MFLTKKELKIKTPKGEKLRGEFLFDLKKLYSLSDDGNLID